MGKQKKLHKQKSKQLVFYFLIYLHIDCRCFINFAEYPKRTSRWGLQISEKCERRVKVWTPFGTVWRLRYFWANLGSTSPSPVQNLLQTGKLYLLEITENSKNLLEKVSTKKSLYYSKKSEWTYNRNMKFRGLKTEFPAT